MTENLPESCNVCGGSLEPHHNATCAFCGGVFHLTWDTRLPPKDCGRFDLDETSLALYFTCNTCLARSPQTQSPTA